MAYRRSNPLALAVLHCLVEHPMHPYEISTTLRARGKEESIKLNYGSLYSVVESLQKSGLIRPRETNRDGRRPERTIYEITDAGTAECEDWLAQLLSTPVREFTSLEAGLSLMPGLPPDDVALLLSKRAERLRVELRTLESSFAEAAAIELPELFLIESRFRHSMLSAELAFVTATIERIQQSTPDIEMWRRLHDLRAQGVSYEAITDDPVRWLGEEAARHMQRS